MKSLKVEFVNTQIIKKLKEKSEQESLENIERIEFICEDEDNSEISNILLNLDLNIKTNKDEESKEEIIHIMKKNTNFHSPLTSPTKSNKERINNDSNVFSSPRPIRSFNVSLINVNNLI